MRAQPWVVEWYVARVDEVDLRVDPKAFAEMGKVLGDELWRTPTAIGPFQPGHNHYAGLHLEHDRGFADAVKDAILASTAPAMKELIEKVEAWLVVSPITDHEDFMGNIPNLMEDIAEIKRMWEARP